MEEAQKLKALIAQLEARLADLQARMPAHSVKPALIAELDELDERLADTRRRLAEVEQVNNQ
ncbi:MAG: hypothetical protein JSV61_04260 [Anaerolineales bacterium]|nr:MAG: hypothetical protein JSV61_04260 [Anaerolineales bacterium]